ncbi:hypothetical protein L1987_13020 [Smallanthus sonchifolius]|uniref:Uncharacterized protein n=1 Tax=Smallanthus sonchifolius TaxID=185202 RepID=A0ACB9JFX6_9ASTR|nr:hypothetical protein L1987_13020 [Smallanthus sonchifolius]
MRCEFGFRLHRYRALGVSSLEYQRTSRFLWMNSGLNFSTSTTSTVGPETELPIPSVLGVIGSLRELFVPLLAIVLLLFVLVAPVFRGDFKWRMKKT